MPKHIVTMNDDTILITELNDFIFCPISIYFHKLYGNTDRNILSYKEDIFRYVQKYYRAFMKQKPIDEYYIYEMK